MAIHTKILEFVYPFTAFSSPIWRIRIANEHKGPNDTVTGVYINDIELTRVFSQNDLRNTERSFILENISPVRILVHFDRHNPPFLFKDFKFRVHFPADPIINNLITSEGGEYLAAGPDTNIITFRERES